MIEPRNRLDRWSLRFCDSGDNTDALKESHCGDRSGAHVRPWSENQAEQYRGLAGRWESLPFPWSTTGTGETGLPTSLAVVAVVPATELKTARSTKVSYGEGDRATEMNEGSLSLYIVALEKRVTRPEDPWSSQGGGRIMDAQYGNYAWTPET
jgi:hypothetical protein